MASHVVTFSLPTGSTAKAIALTDTLADYVADGIACTEASAPNLGRFSVTLDDSVATVWRVFIGATQPDSWDDYEIEIDLAGVTLTNLSFADSAIAKINQHRSR